MFIDFRVRGGRGGKEGGGERERSERERERDQLPPV